MSTAQLITLIIAICSMVSNIALAVAHLQLRQTVSAQTPGGPPAAPPGPPGTR